MCTCLLVTLLSIVAMGFAIDQDTIDACSAGRGFQICSGLQTLYPKCNLLQTFELYSQISNLEKQIQALQANITTRATPQPNITAPECRSENTLNNKCYFVLNENDLQSFKTYTQAQEACESHDASLVFINNQEEYDFLQQLFVRTAQDFVRYNRNFLIGWTSASVRNGNVYGPDNIEGFVRWSSNGNRSTNDRYTRLVVVISKTAKFQGMDIRTPNARAYPICEKSVSS